MKTTIGGERLGSGGKMQFHDKTFNRSTHNLSRVMRTSMAAGTLVPVFHELALSGDSFDINTNIDVKTLPTVGPLYGSYKVQVDFFEAPLRLYQGKLRGNLLNLGLNMDQVYLPIMEVSAWFSGLIADWKGSDMQINPSSILSMFDIRGVGFDQEETNNRIHRDFNAVKLLMYWDIYKQYYANKQEDNGVVIHNDTTKTNDFVIRSANVIKNGIDKGDILLGSITEAGNSATALSVLVYDDQEGGTADLSTIQLSIAGNNINPLEVWANYTISQVTIGNEVFRQYYFYDYSGPTVSGLWIVNSQILANLFPDTQSPPKLKKFPLSNIDDMNQAILAQALQATPLKLTKDSPSPYGDCLFYNDTTKLSSIMYAQEGLGIKTYQSDVNNNWMNTDFIDGAGGINEITRVSTLGDSFTIDALNLASKVYEMLNRITISGGTYDDWLEAVYSHKRQRGIESPMYLGSLIKELAFQEVVSTAESEEQELGTLAGRGILTKKHKGGKIRAKTNEPSYIMAICSITPRVDYSQGNKWDNNLLSLDDVHKPHLDGIGYQDLIGDTLAWFSTEVSSVDGAVTHLSVGKQPAWINYMTSINQTYGNFAIEESEMFMTLNRRYEYDEATRIKDATTYIDPSKYNQIFADTRIDAMNFWVQIGHQVTARRKMSAKLIPNL